MSDVAIPAATLIVVRDCVGRAPELLIVERAQGLAFAAGALVFPGGRIDASDFALAEQLGTQAAAVAAVRETLEETAVPVALAPTPLPRTAAELQKALVANEPFGQILTRTGCSLEMAALTPFARWVPKFHAVRRFDTLFLIARCPPGEWRPQVVEGECAAAEWLSAADVLDRERSGTARLIFPTRRTLERLAQHATFEEMREDALAHAIEPISPWVEERNGEKFITIPSNLGFPVTEERLDGLWRG